MERIISSNHHQDGVGEQEPSLSGLQDLFSKDQTGKHPQVLLQATTSKNSTTTLLKRISCKYCVTQNNPSCRAILVLEQRGRQIVISC